MAEWLGNGLQIRVFQFDSGRRLHQPMAGNWVFSRLYRHLARVAQGHLRSAGKALNRPGQRLRDTQGGTRRTQAARSHSTRGPARVGSWGWPYLPGIRLAAASRTTPARGTTPARRPAPSCAVSTSAWLAGRTSEPAPRPGCSKGRTMPGIPCIPRFGATELTMGRPRSGDPTRAAVPGGGTRPLPERSDSAVPARGVQPRVGCEPTNPARAGTSRRSRALGPPHVGVQTGGPDCVGPAAPGRSGSWGREGPRCGASPRIACTFGGSAGGTDGRRTEALR